MIYLTDERQAIAVPDDTDVDRGWRKIDEAEYNELIKKYPPEDIAATIEAEAAAAEEERVATARRELEALGLSADTIDYLTGA